MDVPVEPLRWRRLKRCEDTMVRDEIEAELQRLHADSFGWALVCCGRNHSEAEEILQVVYVKVLDGSARFSAKASFRTWLFGVIRRTALHQRRKFAVHNRLLGLLMMEPVASDVKRPDALLEGDVRSQHLNHCLGRLSSRQSDMLQLVYYHEMTIEQAAKVLNISLGSARTHYTRGKVNLARLLKEAEGER